jgi:hypothetical protein
MDTPDTETAEPSSEHLVYTPEPNGSLPAAGSTQNGTNLPSVEEHSPIPSSTKACPWERLPFELRDQIFSIVHKDHAGPFNGSPLGYFEWDQRMPCLVVALRPLSVSYNHAMQWFRRFNTHIVIDGLS